MIRKLALISGFLLTVLGFGYAMPGKAVVFFSQSSTVLNNLGQPGNSSALTTADACVAVVQAGMLPPHLAAVLGPEFGYLLAFVFFLLAAGMFLRFSRQKKLLRSEHRELYSQNQQIEMELKEAAAQLYAFTDSIWKKNNVIEAYTTELKKREAHSEHFYKAEHDENMQQLLQATLLTDDQWDSFRQLFDKVHPGFIQRLQETVPGLSPAETRYFVLSKLNLSNKEMAAMLGIGQDSIRQYRSRLRRKLNIVGEDGLHELVASI